MFSTLFGACKCERPKMTTKPEALPQAKKGVCVSEYTQNKDVIQALAVTGPLLYVACGAKDRAIKVYDTDSCAIVRTFVGHKAACNAITISMSGAIFTGSDDKTVKEWDASGRCIRTYAGHKQAILGLCSLGPNSFVSSSSDRTLVSWDSRTGKSVRVYAGGHDDAITCCAAARAGCFVSGSSDGSGAIWDERSSNRVADLKGGHRAAINGICTAPPASLESGRRGLLVYSGSSDRSVKVWDSESGDLISELSGHDGWVYGVVASPDGKWIFSSSQDLTVRGWNAQSGECRQVFRGHDSAITCIGYDPSQEIIYSGGEDEVVKAWKMGEEEGGGGGAKGK